MEKIHDIIVGIETSVSKLEGEVIPPKYKRLVAVNIVAVIVCLAANVIAILVFPKWLAVIFLVIVAAVYAVFVKKADSRVCRSGLDEIHDCLTHLKGAAAEIDDISEAAEGQEKRIRALQSEVDSLKRRNLLRQDDDYGLYKVYYTDLVRTLQKFDMAAGSMGNETGANIRREIARVLDRCSLRFVDYSEKTADCYDIQTDPTATEVRYGSRAIISVKDNKVKFRGIAYVPKRKY